MKIGELIKATRTSRGDTKAGAARALSISRPTLDSWEGNVYIPGEEHELAIAEYLGIEQVRVSHYCGRVSEIATDVLIENGIVALRGYLASGMMAAA